MFFAFLAAVALGVLAVKITSTLVSITSAMRVGNRVVDDPLRTDAGIAPDGFATRCLQPLGHVYDRIGAPDRMNLGTGVRLFRSPELQHATRSGLTQRRKAADQVSQTGHAANR